MDYNYNNEEFCYLKVILKVFGVVFIVIEMIKIVLAILALIKGRVLLKGKIFMYLII